MDAAAELLPKWSPQKTCGGGSNYSKGTPASCFRITVKDYTAWHSRVSKLIFICVLVGTGAILGAITTLNAVGYLSNPDSGFLSTGFTSLPHLDALSTVTASSPSEYPPSTPPAVDLFVISNTTIPPHAEYIQQQEVAAEPTEHTDLRSYSMAMNLTASSGDDPTEDAELAESFVEITNETAPSSTSLVEDDSYEERTEVPPIFDSEFILQPHTVNLATLSDVYHDMSEAELLWRASAGALRRPRPNSVTPKVAYMFLTRGPLPLGRLWERYFKGHEGLYSIYIHAHPNYRPNFPPDSVFYRRNIPSKEVFWGKLSVFAAERRLLANALLDAANERFVLLSESCIPIAPLPAAYKYYMESEHSFVEVYVNLGKGGMGRYNRIKDRRKLRPEIKPGQWRKGSQWFEMSRALALMVVSDRKYYTKYEYFLCRKDCICYIDEHYLPTVLSILAPSKLANRTSHYIDFTRSTAHPHQWDMEGITEPTLKKMTTGHNCTYNGKVTETCHMFARKFSPGTIEPLLELAATILGIA